MLIPLVMFLPLVPRRTEPKPGMLARPVPEMPREPMLTPLNPKFCACAEFANIVVRDSAIQPVRKVRNCELDFCMSKSSGF